MSIFYPLNEGALDKEDANRLSQKLVTALDLLMGAYERRVRSACQTQQELDARPWECAEWRAAEGAIQSYRRREVPMSDNPLATAILKFAPDLALQLKDRWEAAQRNGDQALNEFLAFLRGGPPVDDVCVTCDGTGSVGIPGGRCLICDGSGRLPVPKRASVETSGA